MNAQFKEQADAAFKPLTELEARAKIYANSIITKPLSDGFKKVALHVYTDANGVPIYWKIRLKHPDTGDKWIRSFSLDGAGQFQFKEPDFKSVYAVGEGKKPLYLLSELSSHPEQLVFIVEGEQVAEQILKLGLLATTSGAADTANKSDWQPLAGRTVRIWRDANDTHDSGVKYQEAVKTALDAIGCNVSIVDVDTLGLTGKGDDFIDWLAMREAQGLATTADDVLSLPLVAINQTDESVATEAATDENESTIDDEAEIKRLATLSVIDYERVRVGEAKRLGLRPAILDKLIKQARDTDEQEASGSSLFSDVEVWDDPVNIADVLDEIATIIERHIVCERHTIIAASLWIVFTWCIDAVQIAPIACITAPEKRCGKSQLLRLLAKLSLRSLHTDNITAAALFRSIELWQPTLFIDEADTFLKNNEDMRGVLNAGFERNGCVIRTTGDNHEPTPFRVFGAKAISGIGQLPDTIRDRSIILELRRKQPNEVRALLRHADASEFERIKRKLARWSDDYSEALKIARPALPEALNDRAQDCWESLLSIADLAGESWSKSARHAAMTISGIEEDAPSINEELLNDIKQVFEKMRVTRIASVDLLEKLIDDDEAAWRTWSHGKPMTLRQLGKRLGEFGISSKPLRDHSGVFRGYELSDFTDTFTRYINKVVPSSPIPSVTPLQPSHSKAFSENTSVTKPHDVTDRKPLEPLQTKHCNTVTLENTLSGSHAANDQSVTDKTGSVFI
jgi:hypothetical protein